MLNSFWKLTFTQYCSQNFSFEVLESDFCFLIEFCSQVIGGQIILW